MPLNESALNPFFRKNLLQSCIGESITNIVRVLSINELKDIYLGKYDFLNDYSIIDRFEKIGNYVELHLSNGRKINISFVLQQNSFNIREAIRGFHGEQKNDYAITLNREQEFRTTFRGNTLPNEASIKQTYGKEIKDVFLIKESDFFANNFVSESRADSKIVGFTFIFDSGRISFYKGGFVTNINQKMIQVDTPLSLMNFLNTRKHSFQKTIRSENIIIDTNEDVFQNGFFVQTKEFCLPDKMYKGGNLKSLMRGNVDRFFKLPEYKIIDEDLICMKNVLPKSLIDMRNFNGRNIDRIEYESQDFIKKINDKYKIDIKKQILFLRKLIESFTDVNCFITELKLGINKNNDFKIVKPIDIVPNNIPTKEKPYGNPYSYKKQMIQQIENLIFCLEQCGVPAGSGSD